MTKFIEVYKNEGSPLTNLIQVEENDSDGDMTTYIISFVKTTPEECVYIIPEEIKNKNLGGEQ